MCKAKSAEISTVSHILFSAICKSNFKGKEREERKSTGRTCLGKIITSLPVFPSSQPVQERSTESGHILQITN